MIIGSIIENNKTETRTALTPDVVQKLTSIGHKVIIEKDLGLKSFFDNKSYKNSKAIFLSPSQIYKKADILLQISPPSKKYLQLLSQKQILISNFNNYNFTASHKFPTIIRLEKVPRTSVAQSIDVLSSQSSVRGYISAIYCLSKSPIISPQLMTASTSVKPANALILGASTTGLQAAATFKRNGCIVNILDINKDNSPLATSVGANLLIPSNKDELHQILHKTNFVVGCATPNTHTPQIISKPDLKYLPFGSVIVDTTSQNIAIPSSQKSTINYHFYRNLNIEQLCPKTSSIFWANNMLNLILLITPNIFSIDLNIPYLQPMLYQKENNHGYH